LELSCNAHPDPPEGREKLQIPTQLYISILQQIPQINAEFCFFTNNGKEKAKVQKV